MARYDVYRDASGGGFLVDVQTDLIDGLATRVVIPLLPVASVPGPVRRLHPIFEVDGQRVIMATQLLSAVPASMLGAHLANLGRHHDDIVAALDMLFQGF